MASRTRWLALGGLVLLAAAGFAVVRRGAGDRMPTATVSRGNLRVTLSCAGVLQPPPGGELRAAEPGIVASVAVAEGSPVAAGSAVLVLDSPDLRLRVRQAEDEVLQLQADRVAAQDELEKARRELDHRRQLLAGDERLLAQKAISRSAYEASALTLREAEGRLRTAEGRLRSLEAGGPGESRVALAQARARELASRVAGLTLRAPFAGTVYGLPRRVGEAVVAGQVVASVSEPDRPRLRIKVDQPDWPRIAAGQSVVVSFDGLPERRFEGTLETVSRGLRDAGGREVAEALGAVADPQHLLPLNAAVNVEVVVVERQGVLLVPRAALARDNDQRFVYVLDDGRAVRRNVTVGPMGTNEVEVASGLNSGEAVLLLGTRPVREGQRVAAAP